MLHHHNRFIDTWDEHIDKLSESEARAIITFLSTHGFSKNNAFAKNIRHYKDVSMIGEEFEESQVLGNVHNTVSTLHGLIGIYFKKLPPGVEKRVFIRRTKQVGGEENCWIEKKVTLPKPKE